MQAKPVYAPHAMRWYTYFHCVAAQLQTSGSRAAETGRRCHQFRPTAQFRGCIACPQMCCVETLLANWTTFVLSRVADLRR